jgi:hypothetical protein
MHASFVRHGYSNLNKIKVLTLIVNAFDIFVLYFLIDFLAYAAKSEKAFFQLTHTLYDFNLYFLITFLCLAKNSAIAFRSEILMPERHASQRDETGLGRPETPGQRKTRCVRENEYERLPGAGR